jgi:hypothetical protein
MNLTTFKGDNVGLLDRLDVLFCAVTLLLHTKDLWKLSSTTSVRA